MTRHPETRRSATESIDTKSPDQYVAQQLTATTTHELFKCPIAPSLHVAVVKSQIVSDCAISSSRCEISDDVMI